MISVADFQSLSVTKINILFINNQGLQKDASVTKSMPFWLKMSQYKPVSFDSQV